MGSKLIKESVEFSQFIEQKAYDTKKTCLQTLIEFIEDRSIEPESIKGMISPSLYDKLRKNFVDLGLLKNESRLTSFFEE